VEKPGFEKKRSYDKENAGERGERPFSDRKKPFEKKPFEKKPFGERRERPDGDREKRPYSRDSKPGDRPERKERSTERKPFDKDASRGTKKPFPRSRENEEEAGEKVPYKRRDDVKPYKKASEPEVDKETGKRIFRNPKRKLELEAAENPDAPPPRPRRRKEEEKPIEGPMTLNKYIAHSGECSRRDGAEYVKQGKVRVNGELVLDPGYRVVPGDQVTMLGKKLTPQTNLVYVLLNKPKGFITTTEDPEERKTVMDLVANATTERLYPIGRLDRNTTGVLLLTNDGALAHKLSHPSYNIKKVYQVTLDKNLSRADYDKITKGLTLDDGPVQVDEIAYLENRNEVGVEIHSGRNRIVRRIFESLGYVVEKLDRVMYAGLTKKNVTRGKWRLLTEREIVLLKHFKS
jgi:23S rRNA pseudouridine2605 synthase